MTSTRPRPAVTPGPPPPVTPAAGSWSRSRPGTAPAGGDAWATASRDASGGFVVTIPAGNVSAGEVSGVSCQPSACTVAGVQGTTASGGKTLALRGQDRS